MLLRKMRWLSLRRLYSLRRRDFSQPPDVHSPSPRHQNFCVIPRIPPFGSSCHQKTLSRGGSDVRYACLRRFSSISEKDDISLEEDAERKAGWLLKLIFVGTAGVVGYQFFPYMGDNLLQQSISLLHVKDPLFKRMGASRLSRYAIDDERRMRVVEMGGAQDLLNMLDAAKDDKTRKEALKALVALSHSDVAAEALHQAGAIPIVNSTPNSSVHAEVEMYKSSLLKRFQELKRNDILMVGELD